MQRLAITLVVLAMASAALVMSPAAQARAQESSPPVDDLLVEPAPGESAATATQRAVIERHARLRALLERYGAQHPDVRSERVRVATLTTDLLLESAMGEIDRARVREWVRAQIADVDARLAEMRVSCTSGHVDVRGATARRALLDEALRAIERDGRYVPATEELRSAPERPRGG